MKPVVLPLLLLAIGCQKAADSPAFVDGLDRAPIACTEHASLNMPGTAGEISAAGDTALAALFPDAGTVLLLNQRLDVVRRLQLDEHGPRGVSDPSSVLMRDSLLYVADAKGQKILSFDWTGRVTSFTRTDFVPIQLAAVGEDIAIAPAVIGRFPGTLLYTMRDNNLTRREVPTIDFADVTLKGLGNRIRMLSTADGLVLIHQFFTPRAWLWQNNELFPLQVPLASGVRSAVGYRPPLPLDEEALRPALVVANDAARGPDGELLILTRSGAIRRGGFEKAILRTSSDLAYLSGYRLPVNAGLMAYLAAPRKIVLVDDEDRWYTCALPQ
jgi:hypothetical protein